MTLREKQSEFAKNFALLIIYAEALGYKITISQVERTPEEAQRLGFPKSIHTKKLAGDLNLFKKTSLGKWRYCTKTEDHASLGLYWKMLHPLNRWGGDFKSNPDGNHYSMKHGGIS